MELYQELHRPQFHFSPRENWTNDPVSLPDEAQLSVRLLVDKTSVELFINQGRISASYCFLPSGYVHPLVFQSYEGEQIIEDFELREVASIWT
ncbi:MAG: GH32 C-terminal domain-containing protein [Gammaproteobacteria bacterium]|nr:GH32 C-terminal domain-containing protein [Gammaproteobacteria bacterium]